MLRTIVLSVVMLVVGPASVFADRMASCRRNASPDAQALACSEVIDRKPGREVLADAWTYRGKAYARKGMASEAAENFTQAIRIKPKQAAAWTGRGMARLAERRFDDAIADYSTAIKLTPNDASVYVARGYAFLVKKEAQHAIEDFSKALQISPANAVALNNRGLAYRMLGQNDLAVADYTAAINVSPLYALAYNNRGYAHETLGRKAAAINDFRSALAIDPSLVAARDALVRLSAASTLAAQSTERAAQGEKIAQSSCAWCHAVGPRGDSPNKDAPRFRDLHRNHPILTLRQPITRAIVTPHDKMPKLSLTDAEVDQIIAYINSLRSTP